LEKYFIQEGLAYRLAPVKTDKPEQGEFGMIDPLVMYENMMNKFKWGNAADPKVYLDENNKRMFCNFRRIFGVLGKELLLKGDTLKAIEVAHRGLEIVPPGKMPYDFFTIEIAEVLIRAGKTDEGEKLINDVIKYSKEYLDYAISLKPEDRYGLEYPTGINMQGLLDIYNMSVRLKMNSLVLTIEPEINKYYGKLYSSK
jgi:tetratricopeptide (TPR) repeat protein